jgi:hypothetical protein
MRAFLKCRHSITGKHDDGGGAAGMDTALNLLLSFFRQDMAEAAIRNLGGLTDTDWVNLFDASRRHGLTPLLYHRIKPFFSAGSVPPQVQQRLKEIYLQAAARNMRLYRELEKIVRACNAAGVPVILLKGAYLAEVVYGNIALRSMVDVDLLVKQADLMRSHDILVGQGYALTEKSDASCSVVRHMPPFTKEGVPRIEIHYTISGPPFSGRFDSAELWKRARKVSLQGAEAWALCPEDVLLHLCLHTCISHGLDNGITALLDISHVISHYETELDWEQLMSRAGIWGADKCVFLVLHLAERLLGVSIPEHVRSGMGAYRDSAHAVLLAEELLHVESTPVAPSVARLFSNDSMLDKLLYGLRQAFSSRETMASMYPVAAHPCRLYAQYFFRITGVLKRHAKTVGLLLLRDKEMLGFAHIENKRNALKDWLLMDAKNHLIKKMRLHS